jgi:ketosteroid isomerase-like protein
VDDNRALYRRIIELWNEGGPDAFATMCVPDVVFHELPGLPDTGVFHGVEAFTTHGHDVVATAGHFQFELHSLEGTGGWVLAALTLRGVGPRSGAPGAGPTFHVCRFEDGLLAEMRAYGDPGEAQREYELLSGARE